MSKIAAVALVMLGILTTCCGCGTRRACCPCEIRPASPLSNTLCCPLPPRVPANDGYIAELPPHEPLRIARAPSDAGTGRTDRQEVDVPRENLRPQPEE